MAMICTQLDEVTYAVRAEFGMLNAAQLNIRPAPDKWSVAQVLDHLIVYNNTFLPAIDRVLSGNYKPTLWQRINPLTGFLGNRGVALLESKWVKLKALQQFAPSMDTIPADIIGRFADHQEILKQYFDRVEQGNCQDVVVKLPAIKYVSLKTGDIMRIILEHERRHLEQARRVKKGFIDK